MCCNIFNILHTSNWATLLIHSDIYYLTRVLSVASTSMEKCVRAATRLLPFFSCFSTI